MGFALHGAARRGSGLLALPAVIRRWSLVLLKGCRYVFPLVLALASSVVSLPTWVCPHPSPRLFPETLRPLPPAPILRLCLLMFIL